jgi:hypothetical protein
LQLRGAMARPSCTEMPYGPDCLTISADHLLPTSPEGHPLPTGSSLSQIGEAWLAHEPLPLSSRFVPAGRHVTDAPRMRHERGCRCALRGPCRAVIAAWRVPLKQGPRGRRRRPAGTKLSNKQIVRAESKRGTRRGFNISSVEQLRCIDRRLTDSAEQPLAVGNFPGHGGRRSRRRSKWDGSSFVRRRQRRERT